MKFKKPSKEPKVTSEEWYDLISGYIRLEEILEPKDAVKVKEAVELLIEFFGKAQATGHLEIQ